MLLLEDKISKFIQEQENNGGIPDQFGPYDEDSDFYDTDIVWSAAMSTYGHDFDIDSGVSKLVIIPYTANYVIKIPFSGLWYYEDIYNEETDEYENGEDFFEYNRTLDYCAIEEEVYKKAVDAHLDFLFAKTEKVGEIDNFSIYCQEKVKFYIEVNTKSESYSRSKELLKEKNFSINPNWLTKVIEIYGDNVASILIDFLKENKLSDFHSGNCGYTKDGLPKLSDYSGWDC